MMRKIINNYSKKIVLIIALFTVFSCSKDINFSDLNDTIFVRHRNADMPAYIHGNGSEKIFLIILHGGPGGIGLAYRSNTIKSGIEKECAVVYFDQRGSGMAQGSYSESGINIDIMAEDILALVKVIKYKYGNDSRFFLMGHSWGGTLGPATLLKDQSDFLGWIDVDGAHNPKGIYAEYIANFNTVAAEQIEAENDINYWESVIDLVNNVAPQYNRDDISKLNNEAFEAENVLQDRGIINADADSDDNTIFKYTPLTIIWNANNTQSILDTDLFQNIDYKDRLSEITIPSLVLWGRYDMVVPIQFAQDSFDNLGSSEKELVIFENSGHSPMSTEPALFAEKVIAFINENK
ncbi:alpha/beta hydrolase [uncultured Winogradskyella sp.]|uniref:alpha/beta fold hydrolase n=1 Tax=uncultured Winogradskyella sp. TaxID=395353 RepID=UPI002636A7C5|nr:alpha/beta hydrolase [uncultured Winogradskyella sp.]